MGKVICFDLRPLQIGHENRGIGMVIKSILEHLHDMDNEYIFYTFDSGNPIKDLNIKVGIKRYRIVQTRTVNTAIKKPSDLLSAFILTFHRFGKLHSTKPDVFVQFDFTLGFPKWKHTNSLLFGYDLIPLIMQREYMPTPWFAWNHAFGKRAKIKSFLRAAYYRIKYKIHYSNYRKCDHIVSISDSTTRSFHDLLGIKHEKISTIPLAPVSALDGFDDKVLEKVKRPYLFYIGGTDSRKHVEQVVYAYNIVRGKGHDIQLVLAGNEFKNRRTIPDNRTRDAVNASPYREGIQLLGFVSDAEKNSLYRNAHAFVLCSSYEGFGLPMVEAQATLCPVVAYDNSSITEAAGPHVKLVDTNDYVGVSNRIIELFNNKERELAIQVGKDQSKKFSWDAFILSFLETLNK